MRFFLCLGLLFHFKNAIVLYIPECLHTYRYMYIYTFCSNRHDRHRRAIHRARRIVDRQPVSSHPNHTPFGSNHLSNHHYHYHHHHHHEFGYSNNKANGGREPKVIDRKKRFFSENLYHQYIYIYTSATRYCVYTVADVGELHLLGKETTCRQQQQQRTL